MLKRSAAILVVFLLSVALMVSLFYTSAMVTVVVGSLLVGAVVWVHNLLRPIPARNRCRTCGYSLTGLEPVGICPECGELYTERLGLEDILRERLDARNHPPDPARDDAG